MAASRPTSYRLGPEVKRSLEIRAASLRTTERSLLELLIVEGLDQMAHPGIVFRDGTSGRRAALAVGPDVWEIVSALRWTDGGEEERIAQVAAQFDLHPRHIRVAVDYAAANPDVIQAQVVANDEAAGVLAQQIQARGALMNHF